MQSHVQKKLKSNYFHIFNNGSFLFLSCLVCEHDFQCSKGHNCVNGGCLEEFPCKDDKDCDDNPMLLGQNNSYTCIKNVDSPIHNPKVCVKKCSRQDQCGLHQLCTQIKVNPFILFLSRAYLPFYMGISYFKFFYHIRHI